MRYWIIFILLASLYACALNRAMPEWSQSDPLDPQYYSSVVRVAKADPNYKTVALDNALRNISMQISVQVDASVTSRETESYGVPGSEFNSWVQASTRTQLKDIELVSTFETGREYIAWYRLSKEQYRMQRLRQKEQELAAALGLLEKYDASSTDPAIAIPYLLTAIDHLADYLDMDLSANYKGKDVNVYVELLSRLRALPQYIRIAIDATEINTIARRRSDIPAMITVTGDANGRSKALNLFPIRCEFTQGKGDITYPELTGTSGTSELRLKRVTDMLPEQAITISVDKEHFLRGAESIPARKLFSALAFDQAILHLKVAKPSITVRTWFNGTPGTKYYNLLEDKLRMLNMDVRDANAKADYMLVLNITSKPATLISTLNVYVAAADAQLQIKDNLSGAVVAGETATNIKATAKTSAAAEAGTEMAAVKLIYDEYLFRIINSTIMNAD